MSLYILVGNDQKSSINEAHTQCQKITPTVFNQANLVELMLETATKNVMSDGWQTATFVPVREYMGEFACALSTII